MIFAARINARNETHQYKSFKQLTVFSTNSLLFHRYPRIRFLALSFIACSLLFTDFGRLVNHPGSWERVSPSMLLPTALTYSIMRDSSGDLGSRSNSWMCSTVACLVERLSMIFCVASRKYEGSRVIYKIRYDKISTKQERQYIPRSKIPQTLLLNLNAITVYSGDDTAGL